MNSARLNESRSQTEAAMSAMPDAPHRSRPYSAMEQLPHEVLLDIFSYLDAATLAQTAATSTILRQVALQDVLWKRYVYHAVHSISPPVSGANIHPLESALPLWHPDFGLQADTTHPPSWPTTNEFVQQHDTATVKQHDHATSVGELDLSHFEGASSLYDAYIRFIRPVEALLGWWASDVPFYGMVIRIVLDMQFSYEEGAGAAANANEDVTHSSPTSRQSPSHAVIIKRQSPSIVCQRVYPTNRLQGLDSDMERWQEVTGFPMPSNAAVIGQGTILRRSLTQIRTDLCEPGIRTENLWHFSWDDVQRGGAVPTDPTPSPPPSASTSAEGRATLANSLQAHISSQSWLRSLDGLEASGFETGDDDEPMDDEEDEGDQNEAEQIDRILRRAAQAPAFFNFGFDLEDVDPAHAMRRHLFAPYREGNNVTEYRRYRPPARSDESKDFATVQVRSAPHQPYIDADERNAAFRGPPSIVMPLPPTIFPPPALLPAIRSPPWSRLGQKRIGRSDIFAAVANEDRLLLEGERLNIDSLIMDPPPPYRPWPIQAHHLESGPRFFPIRNPSRTSALAKPFVKTPVIEESTMVSPSLASFSPDITRSPPTSTSNDLVVYQHVAPPAHHDPAHPDFDWTAIEGLYSMTYGPHGIELLYIRARQLTLLDFEPDERVPAWPAEPLLASDDMYEQTRISRRSAARVGARVLEAIKVTGDPNIPRGQITWRAFIDDPGRSGVAWRPPPDGYRKHTPWPLRPPQSVSSQDERSPGLVLPAHGRVAGEGFVGPGWATALACISSIDEIQIWWQPMYKISIAKKLIGV